MVNKSQKQIVAMLIYVCTHDHGNGAQHDAIVLGEAAIICNFGLGVNLKTKMPLCLSLRRDNGYRRLLAMMCRQHVKAH